MRQVWSGPAHAVKILEGRAAPDLGSARPRALGSAPSPNPFPSGVSDEGVADRTRGRARSPKFKSGLPGLHPAHTAISALMPGCGLYPVKVKSSNLNSRMFLTAPFNFITGNGRGSRESCSLACSK